MNKSVPKKLLEELKDVADFHFVKEDEKIYEIIKERWSDAYEGIISIGGDGTHSSAAVAAIELEKPLIPLGYGSGNDFVRALNRTNTKNYVKDIKKGKLKREAVDYIEFYADGKKYYSLVGIHFGVFGESVNVESTFWRNLKKVLKVKVYPLKAFWSVLMPKGYKVMYDVDGRKNTEEDVCAIHIANTPTTSGGGLVIPGAKESDGFLDALIVKKFPKWKTIEYITEIGQGIDEDEYAFYEHGFKTFEFYAEKGIPVGYDGEYIGYVKRIKGKVIHNGLEVLI